MSTDVCLKLGFGTVCNWLAIWLLTIENEGLFFELGLLFSCMGLVAFLDGVWDLRKLLTLIEKKEVVK